MAFTKKLECVVCRFSGRSHYGWKNPNPQRGSLSVLASKESKFIWGYPSHGGFPYMELDIQFSCSPPATVWTQHQWSRVRSRLWALDQFTFASSRTPPAPSSTKVNVCLRNQNLPSKTVAPSDTHMQGNIYFGLLDPSQQGSCRVGERRKST
jgi:hypothetical protein